MSIGTRGRFWSRLYGHGRQGEVAEKRLLIPLSYRVEPDPGPAGGRAGGQGSARARLTPGLRVHSVAAFSYPRWSNIRPRHPGSGMVRRTAWSAGPIRPDAAASTGRRASLRSRNPFDAVEQVPVRPQHGLGLGHERVFVGLRESRLDQRPRGRRVLVVELGVEVEVRRSPARSRSRRTPAVRVAWCRRSPAGPTRSRTAPAARTGGPDRRRPPRRGRRPSSPGSRSRRGRRRSRR